MAKMLVREPSPKLTGAPDGGRGPVDFKRAHRQWTNYVKTVTNAGWDPVVVPLTAPCPEGVFIEDLVFVYQDVAILTRPSVLSRRFEALGVRESIEPLGYSLHKIEAPGTLEGGDLLTVGDDIYVGYGGASNAEGIGQLRAILKPTGANIIAIPTGPTRHLKSALSALPDGSLIGYPPLVAEPELFTDLHPVPEARGANVVLLGENRVLMAANCRASAAVVAGLGFEVVPVDISEFQKRDADVTCLSVLLPDRAVSTVPHPSVAHDDAVTV
jgi:dimethylargininase